MEKNILAHLLSITYTKAGMSFRIGIVRRFFAFRFYQSNLTNPDELEQTFAKHNNLPIAHQTFLREFNKAFFGLIKREEIESILSSVEKQVEALPTITLHVPVQFNEEEIKPIGKWVRHELGKTAIIALVADPLYAGGCGISRKGKFSNYSLAYYASKDKGKIIKSILTNL